MFLTGVLPVCDAAGTAGTAGTLGTLKARRTGNWRSHADSANPSAFTNLSAHGVGGCPLREHVSCLTADDQIACNFCYFWHGSQRLSGSLNRSDPVNRIWEVPKGQIANPKSQIPNPKSQIPTG